MTKNISEDLVNKVQKQMRRMQSHFLVASFAPLGPVETQKTAVGSQPMKVDSDSVDSEAGMSELAQSDAGNEISMAVMNSRQV